MDVYKKRQMNRRRKHGHLSIQALYSVGRPKKQGNLGLCSGLIQGGQLGRGMINGNLTHQEILSFASENYYTKDRTWTGGEVTTGVPRLQTQRAPSMEMLHFVIQNHCSSFKDAIREKEEVSRGISS